MAHLAFVTNAADGTVSTFSLDDGGVLSRLAVSEIGPGCSTLAVDPDRQQVHVAVKGDPPAIVTCRIEGNGALQPISRRAVRSDLHYLTLSVDGKAMLAASYGGGFGISLPVDDSGIGDVVSLIAHPNMHSCAIGPDGRTAYFVSLGADLIAQCALDGATLTPLDPPTVAAPAGSGPRHLVLARDGGHVYVMTEFSGEVLHYSRAADGTLTLAGRAVRLRFGTRVTAQPLRCGSNRGASHLGRRPAPVVRRAHVLGQRALGIDPSDRAHRRGWSAFCCVRFHPNGTAASGVRGLTGRPVPAVRGGEVDDRVALRSGS